MEGPLVLPSDHEKPVECPAARIVFHHRELVRLSLYALRQPYARLLVCRKMQGACVGLTLLHKHEVR